MPGFERWHRLTAALVFLAALALYLATMSPTTSFWDCGEFIAAGATLSVPHPPGAPFYLLLGRIFSLLPLGADIGARVNLISVLSSAATVLLLYLTVIHLIRYWKPRESMGWGDLFGAALGALVFMASDSFWFNAVEAEVYAISMLFTALVVWLAFVWHARVEAGRDGTRILLLVFYLIGLAMGVHLLNVLALPLVFMVIYFHYRPDDSWPLRLAFLALCCLMILPVYPGIVFYFPRLVLALGGASVPVVLLLLAGAAWWGLRGDRPWLGLGSASVLLVLLGYLSYTVILLRSGLNPPLDENDPETIQALIAYLQREQYGTMGIREQLLERVAPFWDYQVRHMYLRYLAWNFVGRDFVTEGVRLAQLWGLPLVLGLWGLVTHGVRDWRRALVLLGLFFLTGLAIVIYLNQPDPQPRERDYSYVGSFFAFALWIGIGAAALLEDLAVLLKRAGRLVLPIVALALVVLLPARMVATGYHVHDRSGNFVAWDYAHNALSMLEPGAILFTNGDNDTFPLWYLQEVEGIRTDVRVVNLSLLNTGWYVRQLRDVEPRVPMGEGFTDEFIASRIDGTGQEALLWRYWGPRRWADAAGRPLPREEWYKVPMRDRAGQPYAVTVPPTMGLDLGDGDNADNLLRVQDRMIIEILRAAQWQRPLYFAVTVGGDSFVGLKNWLRMDGLAFLVMDRPVTGAGVDPEVLEANIGRFESHFRNLDDPSVYYDENIRKLVQNYRSCYVQLALYHQGSRPDLALDLLQRMDTFLPEEVASSFSPELALRVGELFGDLGDSTRLRERLRFATDWPGGLRLEERFSLAIGWIEHFGDREQALALMEPLLAMDHDGQVALQLGLAFEQFGNPQEALVWYRKVLAADPGQRDAQVALIRASQKAGDYQGALKALDAWILAHPEDRSAEERRQEVLLAQAADSLAAGR
jgi:tetratricopeptide (TPR) repeat protein